MTNLLDSSALGQAAAYSHSILMNNERDFHSANGVRGFGRTFKLDHKACYFSTYTFWTETAGKVLKNQSPLDSTEPAECRGRSAEARS